MSANTINLIDEDGSLIPKSAADIGAAVVFVDENGVLQFAPIVSGVNTGEKGMRVYIGPTDPISDLPVMVQYEHHQLHEGESHEYTYPPAALASGSSLELC